MAEVERVLQTIVAARYDGDPLEAQQVLDSTLRRIAWRARRGVKECSSCHVDKKPSEFGTDSRNRDGLHRSCRDCRRA